MENINFPEPDYPGTIVTQSSFVIQPQELAPYAGHYGCIYLYTQGVYIQDIGPKPSTPVTNITISMDVGPNDRIIKPINSDFIGTDIARVSKIPTKTSQLTNNSGFITSAALTGYTTEQRVQEMIDASIGTAIGGTY